MQRSQRSGLIEPAECVVPAAEHGRHEVASPLGTGVVDDADRTPAPPSTRWRRRRGRPACSCGTHRGTGASPVRVPPRAARSARSRPAARRQPVRRDRPRGPRPAQWPRPRPVVRTSAPGSPVGRDAPPGGLSSRPRADPAGTHPRSRRTHRTHHLRHARDAPRKPTSFDVDDVWAPRRITSAADRPVEYHFRPTEVRTTPRAMTAGPASCRLRPTGLSGARGRRRGVQAWFDYSRARDDMFAATDTAWAQWFVASTDDKEAGPPEHHQPPARPDPLRTTAEGGRHPARAPEGRALPASDHRARSIPTPF